MRRFKAVMNISPAARMLTRVYSRLDEAVGPVARAAAGARARTGVPRPQRQDDGRPDDHGRRSRGGIPVPPRRPRRAVRRPLGAVTPKDGRDARGHRWPIRPDHRLPAGRRGVPARVEFLDPDPSATASAAWRPQEAFVVHEIDQSIRAMNRFLSPARCRRATEPVHDGERRDDGRPGRQHAAQRDRVGGEAARGRHARPEQRHLRSDRDVVSARHPASTIRRPTPACRTTTTTSSRPPSTTPSAPSASTRTGRPTRA